MENKKIWKGYCWNRFNEEKELGNFEIKETEKTIKIKSLQECSFNGSCANDWKEFEERILKKDNLCNHCLRKLEKNYILCYFFKNSQPSWFIKR